MTIVFGVDDSKINSPIIVRQGLEECFFQAHCKDTGLIGEAGSNRIYCKELIKNAFKKIDADYENPTKESLIKVVDYLASFSKMFRDPNIIEEHKRQMIPLIMALQ